ncbi:MAG: FtsK/SpoIIIE domain-containing protein [Liquorilactobacillus satsumensis]|uniref:FtsK/SpoIIIE domain-containing protein n=1 Tax=Liquorilactobacillus satsumensis TaxID=259059 RepID=UPI0039E96C93
MIERMTEWLTRLSPFAGHQAILTVQDSISQIQYRNRRMARVILKVWFWATVVTFTTMNARWAVLEVMGKHIPLDIAPLEIAMCILIFGCFFILLWQFMHSKYSPIEKWRMEKLLRRYTEQIDLLCQEDNPSVETKSVRWKYSIKADVIHIQLMSGGHVTLDMEHDTSRRLLSFLIKETAAIHWELIDTHFSDGLVAMDFTHQADERLVIDDLSKLRKSEEINIALTKKLSLTKRQPMGLIVGPTGTGKTTLLKGLIISFLANNSKNGVYTIDGKAAFLSVAMERVGRVATNGVSALQLTDELCAIMQRRYKQMNSDFDSERDVTHVEKFHQGTILLVIDELLALVTIMQADDKTLKPTERIYPRFYANLLSLITKGRQASISVIVSGQMMPATILPVEARSSLSWRISLGSTSPQQAQEIFGVSSRELPSADVTNYGGLIWLDGLNRDGPRAFLPPRYDDQKLPFKATLTKLAEGRGCGGTPQAAAKSKDLPVT